MARQNHSTKLKIRQIQIPDESVWYYNKYLSEEYEEPVYTHRFSVYKYGKLTMLEGQFTLYKEGTRIKIDVIEKETGTPYAPFYGYEYGNYEPLLKVIKKNIDKELNKLGLKNKKNGNNKGDNTNDQNKNN